jgi:putative hydrolase of the HAD superfamily
MFDLGGVLVPSAGVLSALSRELGVSAEALAVAYWAERGEYDLGGDAGRYWGGVLARLDREPVPGLADRLSAMDADLWSRLPAATAAMLEAVTGAAGVRTGVLSNAPAALAAAVRAARWSAAMGVLVFSADLGLAKPDPRIYAAADEACGGDPAEVVFFDDRVENVVAARAHGWDAHVWVDPSTALAVMADRGIA